MRTRIKYLPIEQAIEGMVLAKAATDPSQRANLPAGQALSEENLHQLAAHRVEFVCVTVEDPRTDLAVAEDAAAAAHRVLEIFEWADLSDPLMTALFDQVLTYRSM